MDLLCSNQPRDADNLRHRRLVARPSDQASTICDKVKSTIAYADIYAKVAAQPAHAVDAAARPQDPSFFEGWYQPNAFPIYEWRRN